MRARSKRSMPAGTGVCVVNTPPARTASTAPSNGSPAATSSRIRSRLRNPAWPSLLWNTCGSIPRARRARTPPMPRTISWRSRWCESPPYSRSVTAMPSARVALDVGVEQVQGDLADVGPPDPDGDLVAGEVDRHAHAGVGEPERLGVHVEACAPAASRRRRAPGGSSPRCTAGRCRRAARRGRRTP